MNTLFHYFAGVVLFCALFMVVADILGRWLFAMPFRGSVELVEISMVFIIYLGLGYAEHEGDHVAVDIVYNYLSAGVRRVLDVLVLVFSITIVGLLAWRLYWFSGVLADGGYETAVLRIPHWPVAGVAFIGSLAFAAALSTKLLLVVTERRRAEP